MDFVFKIIRLIGSILLPMFFRPQSHVGLIGLLHAIVVIAVTGGLWWVQRHFHLSQFLPNAPGFLSEQWLPILFLLTYLLMWMGWWLWKLFQVEEEAGLYPDLDACWAEATASLAKVGIGLGDTPVYLLVGKFRGEESTLFQHGPTLAVQGAPGPGAPLRVYAHREAIYITCAGASLSGRQAELLEGPGTVSAGPSPTGSVGGGSIALDKSIGMSAAGGGALGDVQQIIRRARDENRSLTAAEHEHIRALTGMGGGFGEQPPGPAQPSGRTHGSILKNADEADQHAARLRYLCRLIAKSREPLCPLNGVVLLISLNATDNDEDAQQMGLVGLRDLQTIRDGARLHAPVFALVGDLDHLPGAKDFLALFPADKLRQRLGKGFPLVPDVPPESAPNAVEASVRWIFDSLMPFWVFKMFRVEGHGAPAAPLIEANTQLFHFLNDLRPRAVRLGRLIAKAVVFGTEAPPLFGGCYLAGADFGSGPAFVPGFLKRLDETQGYVAWTADAFNTDARAKGRTSMGYIALTIGVLAVAALGVYVAITHKW